MWLLIDVVMRAAHTLAAAAWVGGSIFYLVVVIPAVRRVGGNPALSARVAALFQRIVSLSIGVLLLSGAYLTFDRLTRTTLGWPYIVVLGLKIVAALAMFLLAIYLGQSNLRRLAKRSSRIARVAPRLMLIVGIMVFILGAVLNALFEATIAPR